MCDSITTTDDVKYLNEDECDAKYMTKDKADDTYIQFKEIEEILLQESVIPVGLIIKGVLSPLIKKGKVEKMNLKSKRNFKEDNYLFKVDSL